MKKQFDEIIEKVKQYQSVIEKSTGEQIIENLNEMRFEIDSCITSLTDIVSEQIFENPEIELEFDDIQEPIPQYSPSPNQLIKALVIEVFTNQKLKKFPELEKEIERFVENEIPAEESKIMAKSNSRSKKTL